MLTRLAKISLPLIVLAAATFVATALIATRPKVEPAPPEERVWTVAAVPAIQESVQPTIRAFGEVVARREVELHPLVAGPVVEVGPNFVDGGFVQVGELLIAIETLDYETAIREIEAQIAALAQRARAKKLMPDELTGGTFTISNGGVFGSLMSTPILNPPQTGVLGMHKIQDRPVVVDGQVEVRPMMYLALTYDHRLVDGREAVTFLVTIKNCIEDPARLLFEV